MSADLVQEQFANAPQVSQELLMQEQQQLAMQAATDLSEEVRRLKARLVVENRMLAANADLEAFSYSLAQDLRSSLRQIIGFSKILIEDFGPELPAEGSRHVVNIMQSTQQMGILIDDLLDAGR